MSTIHENHMMYDSWDMEHDRQNFFSFWAIFCPFTPPSPHPNNPDNQNVEKAPGDIIILNKCTINDNHKIYGSWDIKCTRQNVFVILGHYLPYYPFNSLKNENFKKMKKKQVEISSFYICVPKIMIICYFVPEIWHVTDVIVIFHFGQFFALLSPAS